MSTRIQLSRRRGWRMPPGAVKVDRGTRWGNPFPVAEHGRAEAVRRYRAWMSGEGPDVIRGQPTATGRRASYDRAARLAELPTLAGVTLACWCRPDEACHGDVLAALVAARGPVPPTPTPGHQPDPASAPTAITGRTAGTTGDQS